MLEKSQNKKLNYILTKKNNYHILYIQNNPWNIDKNKLTKIS